MRAIKVYQPPKQDAPLYKFLDTLGPKLQKKLRRQFQLLACTDLSHLKEPHYKHFVLEKYNQFFELREKNKILVRIIFMVDGEDILLLTPFIKRQPRDTMRALETSLGILAEIRADPSLAVDMNLWEEEIK